MRMLCLFRNVFVVTQFSRHQRSSFFSAFFSAYCPLPTANSFLPTAFCLLLLIRPGPELSVEPLHDRKFLVSFVDSAEPAQGQAKLVMCIGSVGSK